MRGPRTPTQPRQGWKDVPPEARSGGRLDRGFAHQSPPPCWPGTTRTTAPDRGDTCPWGRESRTPQAQPTEIKKQTNQHLVPQSGGPAAPRGRARGDFLSPASPRAPHRRPRAGAAGPGPARPLPHGGRRGLSLPERGPRGSARGGLRRGPAAPPSGRGRGDTHPLGAAAARSSSAALDRLTLPGRRRPRGPGPAGCAPRLRAPPPPAAAGPARAAGPPRACSPAVGGRRGVWARSGRRARAEEGAARRGPAGQLYAPPLPARPSGRCCPSAPGPPRIPSLGGGAAPPSGRAGSGARPEEPGRLGAPALAEPGAAPSPDPVAWARCHAGTSPGRRTQPGGGVALGPFHTLRRVCPETC